MVSTFADVIYGDKLSTKQCEILSKVFNIYIEIGWTEPGNIKYVCSGSGNIKAMCKFLSNYGDFYIEYNIPCICGDSDIILSHFNFPFKNLKHKAIKFYTEYQKNENKKNKQLHINQELQKQKINDVIKISQDIFKNMSKEDMLILIENISKIVIDTNSNDSIYKLLYKIEKQTFYEIPSDTDIFIYSGDDDDDDDDDN